MITNKQLTFKLDLMELCKTEGGKLVAQWLFIPQVGDCSSQLASAWLERRRLAKVRVLEALAVSVSVERRRTSNRLGWTPWTDTQAYKLDIRTYK